MPVDEHIFGSYNTTKLYNKTEFTKGGKESNVCIKPDSNESS